MNATASAFSARLFFLFRDEDVSGISGTGVVADGIVFPDGKVALRWRGPLASTVAHDSLANLIAIHGHDGRTRVVWYGEGGGRS